MNIRSVANTTRRALTRLLFWRCQIGRRTLIHHSATIHPSMVIGSEAFIGPHCVVGPKVTIGDYTMLASGAAITGGDHLTSTVGVPAIHASRDEIEETSIGVDVWIGRNVTIIAGVTIGDFAIVGAGAVVVADIPDGVIAVGIPATAKSTRFKNAGDLERHRELIRRGDHERHAGGW